MKVLFFILSLVMLQPAIATEAFNEQELSALEKIKATVEGRQRYNQILLDILNEEGVENNERVANFCRAVGVTKRRESLASDHVKGVTRDIELLSITQRIVEERMTTSKDTTQYLTFLQMNINLAYMNLLDEHTRLSDYACNNDFHELNFYKKMYDYAKKTFRKPFNYNEVVESISMVNKGFQIRLNNSSYEFFLERYKEIKKKYASLADKTMQKNPPHAFISGFLSLKNRLISQRKILEDKPFEKLDNYESQKDFFDRYFWPETKLRTFIHGLDLEANRLLAALTVQLQKEFEDDTTEKTLTKAEIKRRNKQKGTSSAVAQDAAPEITSASAETPDLLSWKPVHLPTYDRVISSSSCTASASNETATEIGNSTENAASCAISRLAIRASASTAATTSMSDSIKLPRILKFSDALEILTREFNATIEEGAIYTISLRGPTGVLTNIYCHNSHGAQDDKRWPAWRINMKEGLRAAGFAW